MFPGIIRTDKNEDLPFYTLVNVTENNDWVLQSVEGIILFNDID